MANFRIVRPDTREKWLEFRKGGVGSSEIGILAGVSRFASPIDLWRMKTGRSVPEGENEAMRNGHDLEPDVAAMYARRSGDFMDPSSEGDWSAYDVDRPYMRVSPDRIFWDKDIPAESRCMHNSYIVECKTANFEVTPESYPRSWFFQVQYQMGVLGISNAVIAYLSAGGLMHFGFIRVPFNAAVYAEIQEMIHDFWFNRVLADRMPEKVLSSTDASFMWPKSYAGTVAVADEQLIGRVAEYNRLSADHSVIDKELEAIKLEVKKCIGDKEELRSADGRVLATWKTGSTGRTLRFRKISLS